MQNLATKKYFFLALTALLALIFIYTLPHNFIYHESMEKGNDMMEHDEEMMGGDHTSHGALLHEESEVLEGIVVNLIADKKISIEATTTLKFFVNMLPDKTPVENLEIEHTKYIHVIGVKDDLTNFFHIHPNDLGTGMWGVDFKFKEAGNYKVWSDVTHKGETHSFGHNKFEVVSNQEKTASSSVRYLEFIKNVVVDKYQVSADYPEPIVMGRETPIDFGIKDYTGNGIEIDQYLGADMHLAVIKDDLSEYIHTHPADHSMVPVNNTAPVHDNSDGHHGLQNLFVKEALAHGTAPEDMMPAAHISFSVDFPEAGVYKMFAQFRPKGILLPKDESLVAEFYVKVLETGPVYLADSPGPVPKATPPSKLILTLISIILIAILGWSSYKFINIKS